MPMYSTNKSQGASAPESGIDSSDRGTTDYFTTPRAENPAKVQGAMIEMNNNEAGQHARRAPQSPRLR